jgi:hypothetical protein
MRLGVADGSTAASVRGDSSRWLEVMHFSSNEPLTVSFIKGDSLFVCSNNFSLNWVKYEEINSLANSE